MINKKGFTLIEVLIAVGIVTIVSAVVLSLINPDRQRNRARDAVLQKTVSGLSESVENFRNLRGETIDCDSAGTPPTNIRPYIADEIEITVDADCDLSDAIGLDHIKFWNTSVFANQTETSAANPICLYITNGTTPPVQGNYCIEAQTNDDTNFWFVWITGSSVNRTDVSSERCTGLLAP